MRVRAFRRAVPAVERVRRPARVRRPREPVKARVRLPLAAAAAARPPLPPLLPAAVAGWALRDGAVVAVDVVEVSRVRVGPRVTNPIVCAVVV